MKSLKDILNGNPEECSDKDLEKSILEAAHSENPPKIEKPADADKVTAAMANLSDMVTMADEMYYTLSEMEEIEEEMVGKIELIFESLDDLYKEVDDAYDIAVPEMGATSVKEAEEIIGQSLDSILKEENITEAKSADFNRASRFVAELSASLTKGSKLNKEVNKTLGGNYDRDFKEMQDSMDDIYDAWQDIEAEVDMNEEVTIDEAKSMNVSRTSRYIIELGALLKRGSKLNREINKTLGGNYDRDFKQMEDSLDDIHDAFMDIEAEIEMNESTEISEAVITKEYVLKAMYKDLRAMKVADLKASYQYIKAAHCNTKEGMDGMGTKKDTLMAMYKDLQSMSKRDLMAAYEYIKASHCTSEDAHEDKMVNAGAHRDDLKHPKPQPVMASHCTEESEISEGIDFSKVPDKNLISWVTKFRTVKGNPWSDFKQDMAAAEREVKLRKLKVEEVELDEMETKDDDLAVMIYDYIGADTKGLPLKTLIMQAVGKYFGSQRDKVPSGGESGFEKGQKEDY